MNLEQRVDQLERQGKRLRLTVLVLAVALCGLVTMAAREVTEEFVTIRAIAVTADYVKAKNFVVLSEGEGWRRMNLTTDKDGNGLIQVYNKTMEEVVTIGVEDYGNGETGVWNRKGKGRVYDSK